MKWFLIISLLFVGCVKNVENKKEYTQNHIVDTCDIGLKPFSNPSFIYGSSFMCFMQSLRKTGDYETMIKFTSREITKNVDHCKISQYYEDKFTNMSNLKLKSIIDNSDGTKTMNYINTSIATRRLVSVDIVVENDSCKLIFPLDLQKKILD